MTILAAGLATFGLVAIGLAFVRAQDVWPIAFRLPFALWSLLLLKR
ncbi:MAG TPA: hypothetical protein VFI22_19665 [Thermomicrobiales bacterium]|nr:hypothetical protein [Thermomicrobiales bacterium]